MKKGKWIWLLIFVLVLGGTVWLFFRKDNKNEKIVSENWPTPTLVEKKVKVAVMADVHSDNEELKVMLNKAKEEKVDLVVVAGDLTNEGKIKELNKIKKVLDDSGLKYEVIPGNHEYNLSDFNLIFGKNYQSLSLGEVKLILIDNSYWQGMDEEQKKWVEGEVEKCRILICLAIMHKPLNNSFSTHVMGENNKKALGDAQWLRELLINSGVRQIEAGHLHYASSYELEGIRTDIVGAISRERNTQSPRYTELMIGNNSIERRVVEATDDFGN